MHFLTVFSVNGNGLRGRHGYNNIPSMCMSVKGLPSPTCLSHTWNCFLSRLPTLEMSWSSSSCPNFFNRALKDTKKISRELNFHNPAFHYLHWQDGAGKNASTCCVVWLSLWRRTTWRGRCTRSPAHQYAVR